MNAVRLAFRLEGDWWVGYMADMGTMKDAREIFRVHTGFLDGKEDRDAILASLAFFISAGHALGTHRRAWRIPHTVGNGLRDGARWLR